MKSAASSIERKKLTQVYQYLQALDQMRNPVKTRVEQQLWSAWLKDIPDHECVEVHHRTPFAGGLSAQDIALDDPNIETTNLGASDLDATDIDTADIGTTESDAESRSDAEDAMPSYFLRVQRPNLTECPNPPYALREWLQGDWRQVDWRAQTLATQQDGMDENGNPNLIRFEDDPERVEEYQEWTAKREDWLVTERPARRVMDIFEKLYSLHNQMERESEQVDLMLGDGILSFTPAKDDSIYHPVLLQQVELHFDASVPEFTLTESDKEPELYTALLRILPDLQASALSDLLAELKMDAYHPLGSDETSEFLKRIVTQMSPYGQFFTEPTSIRDKKNPVMTRDPLLFLRKRTLGFAVALERILEDLKQDGELPDSVLNLVGVETPREAQDESASESQRPIDVNGDDERVLLSKEANAEQLQIALRLEANGAVLVQGPPGTGKTHTIANLLGHLLAQGKSVLVTSHTAKALRVLRSQVVKPLQPLCVSVLENDSDSRKQMENSVDAIAERLAALDANQLDGEAAVLAEQRIELLTSLRELRNELQMARQDEYRPIVIAGESYDPSQAARKIRAEQEQHAWIPGPVELGAPLPLSVGELTELYASNEQLKPDAEEELSLDLPNPDTLLSPAAFDQLTEKRTRLLTANRIYKQSLWMDTSADQTASQMSNQTAAQTVDQLERLLADAARIAKSVEDNAPWQTSAIMAGKEGGALRTAWDDFIEEIESVYKASMEAQPHFLKHGIEVSSSLNLTEAGPVAAEILAHLKSGGKLSSLKLFTKREWKHFMEKTKVDGRAPSSVEDFEALRAWILLRLERDKLKARWSRQMSELGGPSVESLTDRPEEVARQFIHPIAQKLSWYDNEWKPLAASLKGQGLDVDLLFDDVEEVLVPNAELVRLSKLLTETLPPVVQAQIDRMHWAEVEQQLQGLERIVTEALNLAPASHVLQELQQTVTEVDAASYSRAHQLLTRLYAMTSLHRRRIDLLQKLSLAAPAWAAAIRQRSGVHGLGTLPGSPGEAWVWRQLSDEIDKRNHKSMDELQAKIADRSKKLREVTASLVEKKAWSAQVKRTTLAQRQALMGWKTLIKKAGKGTGIRAPRLLAEARKLMPTCQTAVPVWIMPLSRVVENFVPGQNHFDVVIIDEASQADVMALTGLYFGNQVLVVGDDEQVSPDAVGQKVDEAQRLIDTYLTDVPNANIYDGKSSIYDLAKTSFPEVQLREHFRCVSPIIQFSNHLSYGGDIRPLRDDSQVVRRPFTVPYRVEGATADSKVNVMEAEAIVSLLVAATEHPAYDDATFGVISLLGDDQAMFIESLLRRHLPATEYQKRLIRCGNSAQFQGDERDVMFLSMVHAPSGDGPLRMLSDPDNRTRKRFNVAASRARDQLWVVHSVDPFTDLKEGDLRRRLILHAADPYQYDRALQQLEERTESEFERLVLRRLVDAGYRVRPQWSVGAYRIDMVVEGGGKRLAVECDGDRWHPPEKLADDMARQAILERLGWRFARIRGSQFFRNPDLAMAAVFERLHALGIPSEGIGMDSGMDPGAGDAASGARSGTASATGLAAASGVAPWVAGAAGAAGSSTQAYGVEDAISSEIKDWIISRAAELRREWLENGSDTTVELEETGVAEAR
ncbi:AAA domain-containing protein [Alicyclobacillus ferrooxydans]|uniref:AAA domain-containing protein n=1 Tax=Alicyclobacillus ferrooxydans TaxID=471514 RepID=UPI0006D573ED|nr:AAA domain-containing protein [Alicyclobacillus ferrooxydans]